MRSKHITILNKVDRYEWHGEQVAVFKRKSASICKERCFQYELKKIVL